MSFRIFLAPLNPQRQRLLAAGLLGAMTDRGTVTKRRLLIEQLCQRQLLASVSGIVFEDTNGSWRPDASETRLASRVVFADTNQNDQIDANESVALTDAAGRFELDGLSGDESIIRLFNGNAAAAVPLFPIVPGTSAGVIPISGGASIASLRADGAITLAGSVVVRTDLATGTSVSATLPAAARAAELLPDGQILALASDGSGNHAFTITASGTVAPIALQTPAPTGGWSDVAIDASGNGVLVEESSSGSLLRAVTVGSSFTVGSSSTTVQSGTRVVGGGHTTTVISTPTSDGIQLRLWSNATGTVIGGSGIDIVGGKEILSYDDTSGLVLLKNASDSVTLLDAAANFASLQTISGVSGPVAIDAVREILFTISPTASVLNVIDLNTANTLGQFAIDASTVTSESKLAFDATTGKLLLLTAAGIAPITLDRSSEYRIKTASGSPTFDLLFAVPAVVPNTPPKFDELPVLTTPEDRKLVLASPKLIEKASDAENDKFIVLLKSQTQRGVVTISPTGGLTYRPQANFFGVDTFTVVLNDGVTASDPIELSINVTPVVDPISFTLTPNEIPENAVAGFNAGPIVLSNVDNGTIVWNVDDPRFQVVNDILVTAPDSQFDYETEPTVTVNVTATSSTSEQAVKQVTFGVGNQDDPIDDIQPHDADIDENRPGELISEITVFSTGEDQQYLITVDDSRFVIVSRSLRLKPGVSLDFESEPTVTVNVTATTASGVTKTQPIVVTVRDIAEQASTVELSENEVKELVRGAVVGDVIVDGNVVGSGYIVNVNDSRFEVNGGKLKLRSSEFVRLADQVEIQVVVTVQDVSNTFPAISGTFVLNVLPNENPFHNPDNPFDVDGNNSVEPIDALIILNGIRRHGGPGPISEFPSPEGYYDVNGDGFITTLDALLILNFINRRRLESEPEAAPQSPVAPNLSAPEITPANNRIAVVGPQLPSTIEPTASNVNVQSPLLAEVDINDLRDQVIELLMSDALSDKDEVEAAINDFAVSKQSLLTS